MTYKYVLLKSSWGIVIYLEVEEIREPMLRESDISVADKIYLRVDSLAKLPQAKVEIVLTQAIKSVTELIIDQLEGKPVCYHVKSIGFNYTDFQFEGLYCAIRDWLSKYYNVPVSPIPVVFDVEKNKYIFDIPEMPAFM